MKRLKLERRKSGWFVNGRQHGNHDVMNCMVFYHHGKKCGVEKWGNGEKLNTQMGVHLGHQWWIGSLYTLTASDTIGGIVYDKK